MEAAQLLDRAGQLIVTIRRIILDLGGFLRRQVLYFNTGLVIVEMALQVLLPTLLHRFCLGLGSNLLHDDVGVDPLFLDRAAGRRVVARRGQPQRARPRSGSTVCTEPLPNERVPRSSARP